MEHELMTKNFRTHRPTRMQPKFVTADDPDKSMWIQVGVIIGMFFFTVIYLVVTR